MRLHRQNPHPVRPEGSPLFSLVGSTDEMRAIAGRMLKLCDDADYAVSAVVEAKEARGDDRPHGGHTIAVHLDEVETMEEV